jgi:hypothetical protein
MVRRLKAHKLVTAMVTRPMCAAVAVLPASPAAACTGVGCDGLDPMGLGRSAVTTAQNDDWGSSPEGIHGIVVQGLRQGPERGHLTTILRPEQEWRRPLRHHLRRNISVPRAVTTLPAIPDTSRRPSSTECSAPELRFDSVGIPLRRPSTGAVEGKRRALHPPGSADEPIGYWRSKCQRESRNTLRGLRFSSACRSASSPCPQRQPPPPTGILSFPTRARATPTSCGPEIN